jgi:hypothetical protein
VAAGLGPRLRLRLAERPFAEAAVQSWGRAVARGAGIAAVAVSLHVPAAPELLGATATKIQLCSSLDVCGDLHSQRAPGRR